jgi:hypothetical protein
MRARMRRQRQIRLLVALAMLVGSVTAAWTGTAGAAPTHIPLAPFTQCPAVGNSPSCQVLLVINPDATVSVYSDPSVSDYDGADDTLVGIWNDSSSSVDAVTVSGPGSDLAGFDGDGLCTYGVTGCPFGSTGYEGPGTSFVTDPANTDVAEVDFAGGLAPNASTYFSLEGTLTAAVLTARQGHIDTLHLSTKVVDWPDWDDPTQIALVRLQIDVANGDGTPAVGATVKVSNSNATFTINNTGRLRLAERLGRSDPHITVQATLGSQTASNNVTLYDVTEMTECHLPGEPSRLNSLDSLLDYAIPHASLGPLVDTLFSILSGGKLLLDLTPETKTTFMRAYKYTGPSISTIYQLQVRVEDAKTGKVLRSWPDLYSRNYTLVKGLFDGDGTPVQRLGRNLVCGAPA